MREEVNALLRQIKYFQAVVRNNSFSRAAEECHISQSAISQQIKALETELGFSLLERKNRKFILTPAGDYFYRKSLILVADYEQLCRESSKIAHEDVSVLKIGYLRNYDSPEFYRALEDFSAKYPDVSVQFLYGSHEELFALLRSKEADLVLNDQRRAFSDEYVNLVLTTGKMYVELSARNPLASLPSVTVQELKNIPCILVASKEQHLIEKEYYQTVIGMQGEFLYADNLEEAHMMVVSGQGFLLREESSYVDVSKTSVCRIPLFREEKQITQNFCLFWRKNNPSYYIEEFAAILQQKYN